MSNWSYVMENEQEVRRLIAKTDVALVERQAKWAGIAPGMRVADVGCGAGVTTEILHGLVQPGGQAVGIDASAERLAHARKHYAASGTGFIQYDIREPLKDVEGFDFIWARFLLEYHPRDSFDIVRNLDSMLRPGGIMCLIDLDYNCLSHYGMSERLESSVQGLVAASYAAGGFDPYAGRRLYSFLYDLGYSELDVRMESYNLVYGKASEVDVYNWVRKVQVGGQNMQYSFSRYEDGHKGFVREFEEFFRSDRRFTYTPMISCRGVKLA